MVLTVSFALFPVTGLVATVTPRSLLLKSLTPASGRQNHTTSPSADQRHSSLDVISVHRIPRPTSVTIAIRPSCGCGMAGINNAVSTKRRSNIFSLMGLDSGIAREPVGQIGRVLYLHRKAG
jgi:hypothetical protein